MNKLKTLCDLNWALDEKTCWVNISTDKSRMLLRPKNEVINIQDLRNEAINGIKALEDFRKIKNIEFGVGDGKCEWRINGKECDDIDLIDKCSLLSSYNPKEVMKWIKYFFNIKKEDLK